jgi:hypothetical protein
MQHVLLHDRARVPSNWTQLIRPGQYAVFLTDVESSVPVFQDGAPIASASEYFCLIFDALPDAESYCEQAVKTFHRMRCEVFDSAGRANPPVAVFVNPEFAHTLDTEASRGDWSAGDLPPSASRCHCFGMRGRMALVWFGGRFCWASMPSPPGSASFNGDTG